MQELFPSAQLDQSRSKPFAAPSANSAERERAEPGRSFSSYVERDRERAQDAGRNLNRSEPGHDEAETASDDPGKRTVGTDHASEEQSLSSPVDLTDEAPSLSSEELGLPTDQLGPQEEKPDGPLFLENVPVEPSTTTDGEGLADAIVSTKTRVGEAALVDPAGQKSRSLNEEADADAVATSLAAGQVAVEFEPLSMVNEVQQRDGADSALPLADGLLNLERPDTPKVDDTVVDAATGEVIPKLDELDVVEPGGEGDGARETPVAGSVSVDAIGAFNAEGSQVAHPSDMVGDGAVSLAALSTDAASERAADILRSRGEQYVAERYASFAALGSEKQTVSKTGAFGTFAPEGPTIPVSQIAMTLEAEPELTADERLDGLRDVRVNAQDAGSVRDVQRGAVPEARVAHSIAQQLAAHVRAMPNGSIEVSLHPEELGRVRMSVALTEAGLQVTVLADRPETADLMRRNAELLMDDFRSLGHLDVALDFGSGAASEDTEDLDSQDAADGQPDDHDYPQNAIPIAVPMPRLEGRVDIRV